MKKSSISLWVSSALLLTLVQTFAFTQSAHASALGSIDFDGNSYISTTVPSGDVAGTGAFTYEFWFYLNNSATPGQALLLRAKAASTIRRRINAAYFAYYSR